MSTPLVFIDSDQGITGLQIHERLRGRVEQQDLKLPILPVDAREDTQRRVEVIDACDITILCLPGTAACETVAATVNPRVYVIDASSVYRTIPDWIYGLPGMSDEQAQRVAGASRVTNPDCYPTGTIGLLRPLMQAGLVPADYPVNIHTVSGYSGGSHAAVKAYEGPETANTLPFQVYGLDLAHEHTPEIQLYTGLTQRPVFVSAYSACRQGIVLTVLLEPRRLNAGVDATVPHACLVDYYAGTPHADVMPLQAPSALPYLNPQALNNTNDMCLSVFTSDHGQVLLAAVFDNLGKGAFDAAVQSLDLMLTQQ